MPFPFESILLYLYRILDISPTEFSRQPLVYWPALYNLSFQEKIPYYFAAWSCDNGREYLPENVRSELSLFLQKNALRNITLQSEIVHLAKLFAREGIPIMFLKGSAGLVRDLYPLGLRFLSDIDALVPFEQADASRELLIVNGFTSSYKRSSYLKSHHIEPFKNPEFSGEIEIHLNPYNLSNRNKPEMPKIWDTAEKISYKGQEIIVPSITDHVWIMMRTDLLQRAFLPRINDVIEFFQILKKGYTINFSTIAQRAEKDNILHILPAMSYAAMKYLGSEPFAPVDDPKLREWEKWTINQKRKMAKARHNNNDLFPVFSAGIRYLPAGAGSKTNLIAWLFRYHYRLCFFILLKKMLLLTGLLKPAKKLRAYLKKSGKRQDIHE